MLTCSEPAFVQLQGDTQSLSGETEVKFQLAKDTLATMLKSMYFIRDQLSNVVSVSPKLWLVVATVKLMHISPLTDS